ncbi:hypothetical protein Ciccas_010350 [Cichlidogyrus casuarinus]|uniref:Uncharacterized protein n=1 Tax=Cichlidogyrus casuarinus TaxID=1844966 RepID=A0ABD2PVJ3_9PLAT
MDYVGEKAKATVKDYLEKFRPILARHPDLKSSQFIVTRMSHLDLSSLGLEKIPSLQFFQALKGLNVLNLSKNKLTELEGVLSPCERLHDLNVSDNRLYSVQNQIWKLHNLRSLNLANNQLAQLDELCRELSHLHFPWVVNLKGNPITQTENYIQTLFSKLQRRPRIFNEVVLDSKKGMLLLQAVYGTKEQHKTKLRAAKRRNILAKSGRHRLEMPIFEQSFEAAVKKRFGEKMITSHSSLDWLDLEQIVDQFPFVHTSNLGSVTERQPRFVSVQIKM